MAQTIVTAGKGRLTLNDWWKGLIMAVVVPVLKVIMDTINTGELTFNWAAIGRLALAAIGAYLLKNLFDGPKIVITGATKETTEAVKDGSAEVKVGNVIAEVKNPSS